MKFNAVSKIDEKKICEEIDKFCAIHGYAPYIFINGDTLKELAAGFDFNIDTKYIESVCLYNGCKTYINNDLQYGGVELR